MSRREGDTTLTAMGRPEPPPPVVELDTGARIGRFVVERRLGAGGMGVVYAARDTALARDVALKVVRPRGGLDAMSGDRAWREARTRTCATVATVSGAATRRLIDQLARSDADLPRALAQLQTADGGNDVLGFAAFGRDTCHSPR